jgi:hypothetical protein
MGGSSGTATFRRTCTSPHPSTAKTRRRSLFEKDKLLFAFLLCSRIMESKGNVDPAEWMFLLTGGLGSSGDAANPAPEWLSERGWKELGRLDKLGAFNGLCNSLEAEPNSWRPMYESTSPHMVRACILFSCVAFSCVWPSGKAAC